MTQSEGVAELMRSYASNAESVRYKLLVSQGIKGHKVDPSTNGFGKAI